MINWVGFKQTAVEYIRGNAKWRNQVSVEKMLKLATDGIFLQLQAACWQPIGFLLSHLLYTFYPLSKAVDPNTQTDGLHNSSQSDFQWYYLVILGILGEYVKNL